MMVKDATSPKVDYISLQHDDYAPGNVGRVLLFHALGHFVMYWTIVRGVMGRSMY